LKTLASIVALVALIALSPLVASAQGTIPDNSKIVRPGLTPYSPGTITPADSLAHLNSGSYPFSTLEAVPTGTLLYYYPAVIQNRWCKEDVPDSSLSYPATGATRWYVDVYPTWKGFAVADSGQISVVGFTVRNTRTGAVDTLTTSAWITRGGTASGPDTLGTLLSPTAAIISGGVPNGKCMANEIPLVLQNMAGGGRVQSFPLYTPHAGWWNGDNIAIRARIVTNYTAAFAAVQPSCITWAWSLRGYR
jgi:hypothetical protein